MSSTIPTLSIDKLRMAIGAALDDERVRHDPKMLLICLSMAEYLKDAERWHYAEGHTLPTLNGKELRDFVDAEIADNRIDI